MNNPVLENPVLGAIAFRRSIRAYCPEQITDEQLQIILDAGEAAPSANNSQPWHFTAVQNAALITRINEAFREGILKTCPEDRREYFSDPAYSVFYHAPTVIFVSCPPLADMRYAQTDCGMAVQTMALAAHAIGLGSVILGMPRVAFAGDEGDDFRSALKFPQGFDFCLALAVGFKATTKDAHPIQPKRVTILP